MKERKAYAVWMIQRRCERVKESSRTCGIWLGGRSGSPLIRARDTFVQVARMSMLNGDPRARQTCRPHCILSPLGVIGHIRPPSHREQSTPFAHSSFTSPCYRLAIESILASKAKSVEAITKTTDEEETAKMNKKTLKGGENALMEFLLKYS